MPLSPRSFALMSSEVSRKSADDEASDEQINRTPSKPKKFPLRSNVSMPPPSTLCQPTVKFGPRLLRPMIKPTKNLMGEDMEKDFQILMRQPAKRERHFNWAAHAQCPKGTLNFFSFSFAQCQRYGDLYDISAHRVMMRYFSTVRLSKLAIKMYSFQICQL